jgi:antitoxin component YwqK of YwqJK toxin-antitoxin module
MNNEIEVKKEFYDNGKLKSETHYKNGEKDGLDTWWHESGNKNNETHYKNDKEEGLSTCWYDTGNKNNETHYKNGERDGLSTYWYYSGNKQSEVPYKNGGKDGLSTYWYESGEKKQETPYKNGKKDGLSTYWYESGEKKEEVPYKNGKRDGLAIDWHETGERRSETHFKNWVKLIDIRTTLKSEISLDIVPIQCGFYFNIYNEDTEICQDLYGLKSYAQGVNVLTGFPVSRIDFYEQDFIKNGLKYAFVEQELPDDNIKGIPRVVARSSELHLIGRKFEKTKNALKNKPQEYLVAILNGYNPLTGEIFDEGSAWKHPQITNDIKDFLNSLRISKSDSSSGEVENPDDSVGGKPT